MIYEAAGYLDDIAGDGRRVFIDGAAVEDVTDHAAFSAAAHSIASLFDIASVPEKDP